MPHSTIILASDISSQVTGTPSHGSDEPHLPGPISMYEAPFCFISALKRATSAFISLVFALSKEAGLIYIMYFIPEIYPEPRALSEETSTLSISASTCSMEVSLSSRYSLIGRIWRSFRTQALPSDSGITSAANSISTSLMSSSLQISRRSEMTLARGKRPYLRIESKEITRGPCIPVPGTILLSATLKVDATSSGHANFFSISATGS